MTRHQSATTTLFCLFVLVSFTPASARASYPKGMDYGISDYLLSTPPACIKTPIDLRSGGPDHPIHVRDLGAENTPQQQAAIRAVEQLVELGLLARLPSRDETYRDYQIADRQAYALRGTFCYGREILTKIISVSPPRAHDLFCVREAEVLTELRDVPHWLGRTSLAPYVEDRVAVTQGERRRTIELQLRDGNWVADTPYKPDLPLDFIGQPPDPCRSQR